jgi:signal transduction histidine kinase
MDNRIQSNVMSRPLMRIGTPVAGRHLYSLRSIGEEFQMDVPVSPLKAADGAFFTIRPPDVTERDRVQEERNAFAMAANAILEEEKARVARELHDDIAQSLTALKMDTIWVRDNAAIASEAAVAKLTDMLETLDRTIGATRRIAADLRPLLLDDLGLVPAIEWLVGNFTQRCGVACKLSVDEELELQEPYATAVFRIVQESLANVAKHAGASEVAVAIDKVPRAVMLTVRDNGCGFATAVPRKPQSLGLMGLRERAQLLGGSIAINSEPGNGTLVEMYIPLPQSGVPE